MVERDERDEELGELEAPTADETFDLDADEGATGADEPQRLDADYLLDRVIPEGIDWRDLVRRHPLVSVGAVAAVGFLLGRSKGAAIVAGVSAGLTTAVMRQLSDVFEGEVFEF